MDNNSTISIVGVACKFAGCANVPEFWRLLMDRRTSLAPLDDTAALTVNDRKIFDKPYPVIGGQLGDLYSCTPRLFSETPSCVPGTNSDISFATQVAFDALTSAGFRVPCKEPIRGCVRVGYSPPFNASAVSWLNHTFFLEQTLEVLRRFFPHAPESSLDQVGEELIRSLPPPDASAFMSCLSSSMAYAIHRECKFTGGLSIIDSGVLSTFTSLNVAIDDLRNNRADVALVGAISSPFSRALLQGFSGAIKFSSKRTFVPFDEKACGTVPGEGCVFFVLKRREDALKSHDRILANIKSICCGNAGTADVLTQAANIAGIDIPSIQMVEANGSGIPEEDAEEVAAIQELWGEHHPGEDLVGIGSVKGNIGHCFRAAAAASMLKATMSLTTRVLLPQLPPSNPLPTISHLGSSAYVINEARPWLTGNPRKPRYAAILAKDFSGHRGAAILAEEIES